MSVNEELTDQRWVVTFEDTYRGDSCALPWRTYVVQDRRAPVVGICIVQGATKEQAEARARLIAAAPQMVGALEELLRLDDVHGFSSEFPYEEVYRALDMAQSALRLAGRPR